jgi:hypothetical protein
MRMCGGAHCGTVSGLAGILLACMNFRPAA